MFSRVFALVVFVAIGSGFGVAEELTRSYSTPVSEYPRWSPDGTRIAFMSNRDGNFEIYVMDAEGGNPTRLTQNVYNDLFPCWSPDGKKIVYSSTATAGSFATPCLSALFSMDADGGNPVRLTNTAVGRDRPTPYFNDSYPVWSPDGKKIAFLSDRRGGWREIFLMNPDGSDVTQITFHAAHHWNLVWTPDSRRILFDGRMDGYPSPGGNPAWGIFSINASGSRYSWGDDLRPFQNDLVSQVEWDSAFSPDGKTVAFHLADREPNRHSAWRGLRFAEVEEKDGKPPRVDGETIRVRSRKDEYWADWSPDGTKIVFVSTRDGQAEIYRMNADGGGVERLTFTP